jgi:hypothetical protein
MSCLLGQSQKLFLIAGQSNAVGVGNADSSVLCRPGTAFEYISTGDSLRPLKDPVGYNAANEDFQAAVSGSAWPSFASSYHQLTGDTVIIIQAAKGATACHPLADAGAGNWSSSYHLFAQAIAKTKKAEAHTGLKLSGIIWLQGESDAGAIHSHKISACQYKESLIDLIGRFRDSLGHDVPFYIIPIGLYTPDFDSAYYTVRRIQQIAADEMPMTYIVDGSTDSYRALGYMNADRIHLGQRALNRTGSITARNIYASRFLGKYIPAVPASAPDWNILSDTFSDTLSIRISGCDCADVSLSIKKAAGRRVYKITKSIFRKDQMLIQAPTGSFAKGAYRVFLSLNKKKYGVRKVVRN